MKVYIRPLRIEDAKTSWKWRNNPDIWKYTGSRPDIRVTEERETEWIKRVIGEKDSARFAIIVEQGGEETYIGNIQLTNISDGRAQYHIFIGDKAYWAKGIGYRATKQILKYAFDVLNLQTVWLDVRKLHNSAIRLYKKCGFSQVDSTSKENIRMEIASDE